MDSKINQNMSHMAHHAYGLFNLWKRRREKVVLKMIRIEWNVTSHVIIIL
jgi:hypothetical protein